MTGTIDGVISNDLLDKVVVENKIFIYLERTNPALHKILFKIFQIEENNVEKKSRLAEIAYVS